MRNPSPQVAADGDESRHRTFWVGLILALLGGQILLICSMAYVATSDRSFAIEPDYYQKGLHWDETAAQNRKNAELGWTVQIELGAEASLRGERTVTCRLHGKSGQALDGATVDLVAFPHARGTQRAAASLTPTGEGAYAAPLQIFRPGVWEFRLVIQRGPETFTHTLLRDVPPAGAS